MTAPPRWQALADAMAEDALQESVVDLAATYGWLVHHTRPARTAAGSWRTPIQGHKGFPDLVLAQPGRVLFVELKSTHGALSDAQQEWANVLSRIGSDPAVTWRVWRPADWFSGEIRRVLGGAP